MLPKGKVVTYGDIAILIGRGPKTSRFVGYALHGNKFPVDIPCHRVVNRFGQLTNSFAFGGVEVQRQLLLSEEVDVSNENTIDIEKYHISQDDFNKIKNKLEFLSELDFEIGKNMGGAEKVRNEVFVNEQGFNIEEEFDSNDEISTHVVANLNNEPIACARLFVKDADTFVIGRICVLKPYRMYGLGYTVISLLEEEARKKGAKKIIINGQLRLQDYYGRIGYIVNGEIYQDGNIPHIPLIKTLKY